MSCVRHRLVSPAILIIDAPVLGITIAVRPARSGQFLAETIMIGKLTQSSPVNRGIAALALVLGLAATCAVFAYPTPAASSTRWELDFRPGDLRLYRDAYDNQYYWYFTYKVTNRTGADQTWAPTFALFNDASEILNSGIGVPRRVTSDILEMLGNDLMEN